MNYASLNYSLFSILAYSVAFLIFYLEARRKKLSSEYLLYVMFAALLGALIGSRLGSALFVYREFYLQNPQVILYPQAGGKTIVGGLIGGYIAVLISKKILKINYSTGDLFAPALAIGITIGRVGCFLNGCCYGVATNMPWGVFFRGEFRHPTQIYESLFCLLLFIYLWSIRKRNHREGDLFKIFLIAYTFFRFCIEFLRADKVLVCFNLSIAQVISGIVFLYLAGYFLVRRRKRRVGL